MIMIDSCGTVHCQRYTDDSVQMTLYIVTLRNFPPLVGAKVILDGLKMYCGMAHYGKIFEIKIFFQIFVRY